MCNGKFRNVKFYKKYYDLRRGSFMPNDCAAECRFNESDFYRKEGWWEKNQIKCDCSLFMVKHHKTSLFNKFNS